MADYVINPNVGVAGSTTLTARSLPFMAQSVRVDSGQNWVGLPDVGLLIPPYTTGYVANLPFAVANVMINVTAPPDGAVPVGPGQQTATTVTYSDQPDTPSSGVSNPAQTIALIELRSTGIAQPIIFTTGLARALTVAIAPVAGGQSVIVSLQVNGIFYAIGGAIALAAATPNSFSFGQGTGWTLSASFPLTFHLPARVQFTPQAVINTDFSARFYY